MSGRPHSAGCALSSTIESGLAGNDRPGQDCAGQVLEIEEDGYVMYTDAEIVMRIWRTWLLEQQADQNMLRLSTAGHPWRHHRSPIGVRSGALQTIVLCNVQDCSEPL